MKLLNEHNTKRSTFKTRRLHLYYWSKHAQNSSLALRHSVIPTHTIQLSSLKTGYPHPSCLLCPSQAHASSQISSSESWETSKLAEEKSVPEASPTVLKYDGISVIGNVAWDTHILTKPKKLWVTYLTELYQHHSSMQFFYRVRKPLECGMYNLGQSLMRISQMRGLLKYGVLTRSLNSSLSGFFCRVKAVTHKRLDVC